MTKFPLKGKVAQQLNADEKCWKIQKCGVF